MVRKQGEAPAAQESLADEKPTCEICSSAGPFEHAYQCTFKDERHQHSFYICKSGRCQKKFEEFCLEECKAKQNVQIYRRLLDFAKKGKIHCYRCFFLLQEKPVPLCDEVEDVPEPPPPPSQPSKEKQSAEGEAAGADIADVDFDTLEAHVKENPEGSPMGNAKKGKKGKKNQGKSMLPRDVQVALFFEDNRLQATEEGEILPAEEVSTSSMSTPTTRSVGATPGFPGLVSTAKEPPLWPPAAKVQEAKPAAGYSQPSPAPLVRPSGASKAAAKPKASENDRDPESSAAMAAQAFVRRMQPNATSNPEPELPLPPRWKSEWDPSSKKYYYWNMDTRERTWEIPTKPKKQEEESPPSPTVKSSSSTSKHSGLTTSSSVSEGVSQASTTASTVDGTIKYLCTTSWIPEKGSDDRYIRLTHGERVILESETLSGWGVGTVVPEKGETARSGYFPRWAVSDNPAPDPFVFPAGSRVLAVDDFESPADGYLSIHQGESFIMRWQDAPPYVWLWAESEVNPSRKGWVPEAVLRLA